MRTIVVVVGRRFSFIVHSWYNRWIAWLGPLELGVPVFGPCEITADNNYSSILGSSSDIPLLREELIGFE